jgi:hypothetical protein
VLRRQRGLGFGRRDGGRWGNVPRRRRGWRRLSFVVVNAGLGRRNRRISSVCGRLIRRALRARFATRSGKG